MRRLFIIMPLLLQFISKSQTKAIYVSTNEKLSQAFGQSLLPITTEIKLTDQSKLKLTYFDFAYINSTSQSSGTFVAVAKPGDADLVRHDPILTNTFDFSEEFIKKILSDPNTPDTIVLTSMIGSWSDGVMKFKVTDAKILSKNSNASFDFSLTQQIKSSPKLNFSLPTKNISVKLKDNKKVTLAIKPFFAKDQLAFTIAPQNLYKVSQLENSLEEFDPQFNYSNCSFEITYDLFNYINNLYYTGKEIKVKKEDLNFVISKIKILGKADGAVVTCQIKNVESKAIFDGKVNLAKDMSFQNCVIKPRARDPFSIQASKLAEKKINEKFSNKFLLKDADLSQVFPYKMRDKQYKLYIDIRKVIFEPRTIKVFNQLFIEKQ